MNYSPSYLFFNNDTLSLNGRSIIIMNNKITPTIVLKKSRNYLYSLVFYSGGELETKMNINLYGTNPSFTLYKNDIARYENTAGYSRGGIIGIALINNSQLNFVNNSNSVALITLREEVTSFYLDNNGMHHENSQNISSTITFKNGEYEENGRKITYNGPIGLDIGSDTDTRLTTMTIKTNTINIETKTILLLNHTGLLGSFVGVGGTNSDASTLPKLNIGKNGKLIISLDLSKPENIKINKPYTIISGFIITEDTKNKIILNKNLDAVINYIDDADNSAIKTVTILFNSLNTKIDEEIKNNHNYNIIYSIYANKKNIMEKKYIEKNKNAEIERDKILKRIAWLLNDFDNSNTIDDKISLIRDILPTEPSDIVAITSSLIAEPINNAIINRLTTTNIINLRLNNDITNSDENIGKNKKNAIELWFDTSYGFSYNYGSKNSINFTSIVIGGDYHYGQKNNLLGLTYSYTNGNNSDYTGSSVVIYFNKNLDEKCINFISFLFSTGNLYIKEVRNSNKDNIAIIYNYSTDISVLTGIFGHNIKLINNDVLTLKTMVRYSETIIMNNNRDFPDTNNTNNIDLNMTRTFIEIITPAIGVDYQKFINKTKTLIFKSSINFKYNINLTDNIDTYVNSFSYYNTTADKALKYDKDSINNFVTELSFTLDYYNPTKPNLKFSINSHINFSTNKYINASIGVSGALKIR